MTKIKICGLRRPQDIEAVNAARPDFAGFVVEVPGSRRSVDKRELRELAGRLEEGILSVESLRMLRRSLWQSFWRKEPSIWPSCMDRKTKSIWQSCGG